MRSWPLAAPITALASAAFAQPAPAPEVQRVLADPATVDRMADTLEALSDALLDLPVGEVRAAVEGRKPTPADRRATVRSESGLSEQELRARIAAARPVIHQSMKALSDALPAILQGVAQVQRSVERAAANMPDPNYPKR